MGSNLAPFQKRTLRRLVELSTSLQDIRYGKVERKRELEVRLAAAHHNLATWKQRSEHSYQEADRVVAERQVAEQSELVRDLQETRAGLQKEIEAMGEDCNCAGRLVDRLLGGGGRNVEDLDAGKVVLPPSFAHPIPAGAQK